MAPALRRGFIAYCDPTVSPMAGDIVVVYDMGGLAFVREYVGETPDTYTLRSYAPAADAETPREYVKSVHVVVQTERRPA